MRGSVRTVLVPRRPSSREKQDLHAECHCTVKDENDEDDDARHGVVGLDESGVDVLESARFSPAVPVPFIRSATEARIEAGHCLALKEWPTTSRGFDLFPFRHEHIGKVVPWNADSQEISRASCCETHEHPAQDTHRNQTRQADGHKHRHGVPVRPYELGQPPLANPQPSRHEPQQSRDAEAVEVDNGRRGREQWDVGIDVRVGRGEVLADRGREGRGGI